VFARTIFVTRGSLALRPMAPCRVHCVLLRPSSVHSCLVLCGWGCCVCGGVRFNYFRVVEFASVKPFCSLTAPLARPSFLQDSSKPSTFLRSSSLYCLEAGEARAVVA
jgi:hypothetical protein